MFYLCESVNHACFFVQSPNTYEKAFFNDFSKLPGNIFYLFIVWLWFSLLPPVKRPNFLRASIAVFLYSKAHFK